MRLLAILALVFLLAPWAFSALAPPQHHVECWPDGSLRARVTLRWTAGGVLEWDGPYESRFANGQTEVRGNYRDNRRTGTWTAWYPSGRTRAIGTYVDGREEGVWRYSRDEPDPPLEELVWRAGRVIEDRSQGAASAQAELARAPAVDVTVPSPDR